MALVFFIINTVVVNVSEILQLIEIKGF